jgi:hypothetical protein
MMEIKEREDLEALVDKYAIDGVASVLEQICYAKAEHVRSNWQDENLAKEWESAAKILDRAALKLPPLP